MKAILISTWVLVIIMAGSCKKDSNNPVITPPGGMAKINFELQSVGENENLGLELGKVYVTDDGDSISFELLRYWISNLEFIAEDGSVWSEKNSYRLLENTDTKVREEFEVEVPVGKYQSIRFSIGVAPNQNSSLDSVQGELDPGAGMSWTWNTGYIFMLNKGQFYNSDSMDYTHFQYHIGTDVNYKTITLNLPAIMNVTEGSEFNGHIVYHALDIFSKPNPMNLKLNPALMVGPADQTAKAAENYSGAFELHHFQKK